MEIFPEEVELRGKVGQRYDNLLIDANLPEITVPHVPSKSTSVYAQYTILFPDRGDIREKLSEKNIPTVSYYTVPLHLQPVFSSLGHQKGEFPVTESVADQCLSLPMSPYLSKSDQEQVIRTFAN